MLVTLRLIVASLKLMFFICSRSRGWTGVFHFDCDEFSTEEEWDDCRNDCKECPKSVENFSLHPKYRLKKN